MRIKLLLIMPTMGFGGTERQVMELCKGLDPQRFDVTLLVLKDAPGYLDHTPIPGRLIRLQLSHCYNIWEIPRLARIIRQGQYDIVHTLLPVANFWGGVANLFSRTKHLFASSRNVDYPPPRFVFYLADFLSFHLFCDTILSNSEWGKTVLSRMFGAPLKKIKVILNGHDFERLKRVSLGREAWRKQMDIRVDVPLITCVARLMEQKGIPYFLQMVKHLKDRSVAAQFLLVGDGPDRPSLENQAQQLGIRDILQFAGFRNDMADILHASDVFVLPSLYEGCPNAILEALSVSLPVVTTDIAPHRELLTHGENALLTRPRDAAALADAVETLLADPALGARLAEKGKTVVLERYAKEIMIRKHEELYASV